MARFGVYQVDEYKKKKTRAVLRRQSKDKRYIFGACGRHTSHYMDGLRVASWKYVCLAALYHRLLERFCNRHRIYRKSVKPLVLKAVSDIMALLYPSKETSLTYEVQSQKSVETHTLSAYHHKNAREEDRSNCRKVSKLLEGSSLMVWLTVGRSLNPGQNVSDTRGGRGSCHGDFLRDALAKRFAVIHGEKDSPASSTDSEGSTTPLRQHLL
eukprot:gb/GECG01003814.1/.p1 GENE.gb/GECG01003814.1/~~gb/GECG01003814.1/.p1  ORF type:complete len:212 (+),score=20.13 gb/GECG01003814.1/:1-636(+)